MKVLLCYFLACPGVRFAAAKNVPNILRWYRVSKKVLTLPARIMQAFSSRMFEDSQQTWTLTRACWAVSRGQPRMWDRFDSESAAGNASDTNTAPLPPGLRRLPESLGLPKRFRAALCCFGFFVIPTRS